MSKQIQLSPQTTQLYQVLLGRFKRYTELNNITMFNADDFRLANLDTFFMNKQQDIGIFFRWLVTEKHVLRMGEIPSINPRNNQREIKLYRWTKQE